MKTSPAIVLIAVAIVVTFAEAKAHKLNRNFKSQVDLLRTRRQSHPDETVARIPEIPFTDQSINDVPDKDFADARQDPLPVPAEYLTPPAIGRPRSPPVPLPPLPLRVEQPPPLRGKWKLGYEAGDILVPPLPDDQGLEYDTLKTYVAVTSPEEQPTEPQGTTPPELDTAADSPNPIVENPDVNVERQESDYNPQSVYSFVKTNPQGHFKWGVHIGH